MKPKGLAIDLDGTLLGPDDDVSPRNRKAIASARSAGLHVIIATARWYQNAERVATLLELEGPVIACSGAEVRRLPEGEDLRDVRMPKAFADALYEICDAQPCIVWSALDEDVLMKIEGDVDPALMLREIVRVPSLRAAASAPPRVVMIQGRRIRARVAEALEAEWGDRVRFVTSITSQGHELLTLTATGADKGLALEVACRDLGITPEDVVAFGDADNDIELFARAGASFAMGQATDAAKAAATAVTAPNTEDGVAQAIEQLLAEGAPR
jgi:Cof subfamily protein (haloacid dehalogenase superfamily)